MNLVKAVIVFVFLSIILPSAALAQDVQVGPCQSGIDSRFDSLCQKSYSTPIGSVLGNVLTIILTIATVLGVIFILWGGIKWITSGGDKAAVDTARKTVMAAIIGLILTFLSFFILSVVFGLFGLNLKKITLPRLTTDTTTCASAKEYYDSNSQTCKRIDAVYCDSIGQAYDSGSGTCKAPTGPR